MKVEVTDAARAVYDNVKRAQQFSGKKLAV